MTEEFLQFVWKYRMFAQSMMLTDNSKLEVIKPGDHNKDAGPDFTDARVRIDGIEWAGNIEIHTRTSLWVKHGHEKDEAYKNVILHVVYESDDKILRDDGSMIPELELSGYIAKKAEAMYEYLLHSNKWIACEELVDTVDSMILKSWIDVLAIERLDRKLAINLNLMERAGNDFMSVYYLLLFRSFGYRINAIPFEWLQRSFDYRIIDKIGNNIQQMEALLFGQAGFLSNTPEDTYTGILQEEYHHLKNKFKLEMMEKHTWKFLRLRPPNFPTIRIAQLATFLISNREISIWPGNSTSYNKIKEAFLVSHSEYWNTHYVFGKYSKERIKYLGGDTIDVIILNFVVPVLLLRSYLEGKAGFRDQAIQLMQEIHPEKNAVISAFLSLGFPVLNAFDSQALLELKSMYCRFRRCLDCRLGYHILRK